MSDVDPKDKSFLAETRRRAPKGTRVILTVIFVLSSGFSTLLAPEPAYAWSASPTIAVGTVHMCSVDAGNVARCWGDGDGGTLGNGTTSGIATTPVTVSGSLSLRFITAGDWHTCAITTSNDGYCWGKASNGRLGNNSSSGDKTTPVAINGGRKWLTLSAGNSGTCGVTTDNEGFCWGSGGNGRIGNGGTSQSTVPTSVNGGYSWSQISQGNLHSCGVTTTGVGYCWGGNTYGQLGTGNTDQKTSPTAVTGGFTWAWIEAGQNSTCGVTTTGEGYCWGLNGSGQLGINSTSPKSDPTLIDGDYTWSRISMGDSHSCGITTSGAAYCWGNGGAGRIGDGGTSNRLVPTAVSGGDTFSGIAANGQQSCGVTTGGVFMCWGENSDGRLGDGGSTDRKTPVTVHSGGATATPVLTQSQYRWYGNVDGTTLGSALAAQNTTAAMSSKSTIARLRMNVGVDNAQLAAGSHRFKLQYGASTSGPWTDVSNPWWDTNWATRKQITIDNSASATDLIDFPVRVSLSASNIDYSKTQDAGEDVRFVDSDGTLLKHEIEVWDEGGTSEVWVKVPKIEAQSTLGYIYLYYDNAAAPDGQDSENVWDSNATAAWHLKENPTPVSSPNGCNGANKEVCDSTGNSNDGDSGGSMNGADSVDGKIGKAIDFDGNNDEIVIPDDDSLDATGSVTLSTWVKVNSIKSYQEIACKNSAYCLDMNSSGKPIFAIKSSGTWYPHTAAVSLVPGTWYHVAGVFDTTANKVTVYVNGEPSVSETENHNSAPDTDTFTIGSGGGVEFFAGAVDEMRTSNVARSADWIRAEYASGNNDYTSTGTAEANNAVWRFYDNPSPANGATLASTVLGASTVNVSYVEGNPTAANPNTIPDGGYGEWDFPLDPSGAASTDYYFRIVLGDGTELDAYTRYPRLDTSFNNAPNPPTDLNQTKTDSTPIPGTTHYNWDANTQGWGAPMAGSQLWHESGIKRTGAGSLNLRLTGIGGAWIDDEQWGDRNLTANGPIISAWVYVPAAASGTSWWGQVQIMGSGGAPPSLGPTVELQRDTWTLVSYAVPPETLANMQAMALWINGGASVGTDNIYIDDFQQGSGIWTNETSVRFAATVSDLDGSDTDQLCIEAKPIGVSFTNTEDSCATGVAYSGTPVATSHTLSSLTDGTQYHWQARTKDAAGEYSNWVPFGGNNDTVTASADFGVDTSVPSTGTVRDGASQGVDANLNDGSLDTLAANWSDFADASSGIARYEYSIGTSPGDTDTSGWLSLSATSTDVARSGLTLHTGQTYYVNVRAVDALGQTSAIVSSSGVAVAPTLNFATSSRTIEFDALSSANAFSSGPETIDLTTSTNARGGYVVRQYTDGPLSNGSTTIDPYSGTYASPTAWAGDGFGYTSNDASIQAWGNKFSNASHWAGLTTSAPGDIVADHGAPIVNQVFQLSYRVDTPASQAAGLYTGNVRIGATAVY